MSNGMGDHEDGIPMVRLVISGSVDDGKSTLIGRLLFDSKQILADQVSAIRRASQSPDDTGLDLSLLTDGLRAEREQGITIDVAYRHFRTPRRKFIIADTPGHELYTRNMVTGASTADLAVILVDAAKGVSEQTRRHAFIASLLGIRHLVVCVNKMDLVAYGQTTFDQVESDFREFSAKLETTEVTCIPISAIGGENVVERSERMPWYEGPSLLYQLEHVHVASDRNLIDCRFPVQWVTRPAPGPNAVKRRLYSGQIAAGVFRPGDEVVVLPSGEETEVASIESFDGPLERAFVPMSVSLSLKDEIDVARGDMISRPHNRPTVSRRFEALLCWMGEKPGTRGDRYELKHTTRWAGAIVEDIRYRIDVNTFHRDERVTQLRLNEIGRVALRTSAPLMVDDYRRNRTTGSFVLVDRQSNDTVAAGMIVDTNADGGGSVPASAVLPGAESGPSPPAQAPRAPGAIVWLVGGAPRSQIAVALKDRLIRDGGSAYVLEDRDLRGGLNSDLGLEADDHLESIRRITHVAALFAGAGTIAIVSLESSGSRTRPDRKRIHQATDAELLEVLVRAPPDEAERERRFDEGELSQPDLELRPAERSIDELVEELSSALWARCGRPAP